MVHQKVCLGWYARKDNTRWWLFQRSLDLRRNKDLLDSDMEWIMKEEENETCLLCYGAEAAAAAPGAQEIIKMSPASGGGEWWIKEGNVITLPELLWGAKDKLSAFDIYNIYLCLPAYCYKKTAFPIPVPQGAVCSQCQDAQAPRDWQVGLKQPVVLSLSAASGAVTLQ